MTNPGNLVCAIAENFDLTCVAQGAAVTFGASTGSISLSFMATPSASGIFDNPRSGGSCQIDPESQITEFSETNNASATRSRSLIPPMSMAVPHL